MAGIPTYEQRTNPSSAGLPSIPSAPLTNGIAEGLQSVAGGAQSLVDLRNTIDARDYEQKKKDAAAETADKQSQTNEAYQQWFQQQKTDPNVDIDNFTPNAVKKLDSLVASQVANSDNPITKRFLREQGIQMRERVFGQALQFQAQQQTAQRLDKMDQGIERTISLSESDPENAQLYAAQQMAAISAIGVEPDQRLEMARKLHAGSTEAAATGIAQKSPISALARLKAADPKDWAFADLPLQARNRIEQTAKTQITQQTASAIVSTFSSQGMQAGMRAMSALDKRTDIPPDILDDVRAKANEGISALRTERLNQHADVLASIESQVAKGTATQATHAQLSNLWSIGALSPVEYASMGASIDRSIMAGATSTAGADALEAALKGGLPLDPKNPDHQYALDSYFYQNVKDYPQGSPQWASAAVALATRTRMLPKQAVAYMRSAMRSPNNDTAANGAQLFGSILRAAPDAVSQVDEETKSFAGVVNGMVEGGTTFPQAVQTARADVFDLQPDIAKRRKEEFAAFTKDPKGPPGGLSDKALTDYIHSDWGHFFGADPAPMTNLKGDFESQTERYYTKTGDIKLARDLAWKDLKNVYGVSKVNGVDQVMAFPPERFGIEPADVQSDVAAFLAAHPQSDGSTAKDVAIVPDALTLRMVNDALSGQPVSPSYKLVTKSGDLVVDDKGVPKRYTIPSGDVLGAKFRAAQAAAAAKAAKQIADARAARTAAAAEPQMDAETQLGEMAASP